MDSLSESERLMTTMSEAVCSIMPYIVFLTDSIAS